jgi:hypothetical protein
MMIEKVFNGFSEVIFGIWMGSRLEVNESELIFQMVFLETVGWWKSFIENHTNGNSIQ